MSKPKLEARSEDFNVKRTDSAEALADELLGGFGCLIRHGGSYLYGTTWDREQLLAAIRRYYPPAKKQPLKSRVVAFSLNGETYRVDASHIKQPPTIDCEQCNPKLKWGKKPPKRRKTK